MHKNFVKHSLIFHRGKFVSYRNSAYFNIHFLLKCDDAKNYNGPKIGFIYANYNQFWFSFDLGVIYLFFLSQNFLKGSLLDCDRIAEAKIHSNKLKYCFLFKLNQNTIIFYHLIY